MTVVLDGASLDLEQVRRVARHHEPIEISAASRERIKKARAVVERAFSEGQRVYGLNTGVGVLKRVELTDDVASFNRRLLEFHRLGQGERYAEDIVRAAMLRLINQYTLGTTAARVELVDRLVNRLNEGVSVDVNMIGGSLCTNADLALGFIGDFPLSHGEGLALLGHTGLADGASALVLRDLMDVTGGMEAALALSLEAFRAKISPLDERVVNLKKGAGVAESARNVRRHLGGTRLWDSNQSRNLQDPLSFRCGAYIIGAFRDALGYGVKTMNDQLNSSCSNPVVLADTNEILHAANWEIQAITTMLDFVKLAVAPVVTVSQERSIKLLDRAWSGLPTGLIGTEEQAESGLAMYQILVQALTVELRLAAAPSSLEISSTTNAEGIEDRFNWGQLSARRLGQIRDIAMQIIAIELLVGAQAVELRGIDSCGEGIKRIWRTVRECVPFITSGQPLPRDLSGLVKKLRDGSFD